MPALPPTRRTRSARRSRGFTLLELMVVAMIIGTVILMVPMNMQGFSARSRLEMAANSVVASLAGTREQAVQDGYESHLELGWIKVKGQDRAAMRLKFTNLPTEKGKLGREESSSMMGGSKIDRSVEREWVYTDWKPLPKGIVWVGVSEARGQWKKLSTGGKGYSVRFFPSGDTEFAVAIRLESEDLENVEDEYRVVTVVLNGLTSEPSWSEGKKELRESLDDSHFSY